MGVTTPDIPEEVVKAINDYFTPDQLVEYLGLTTEDLTAAFPDELADRLDELLFVMEYVG